MLSVVPRASRLRRSACRAILRRRGRLPARWRRACRAASGVKQPLSPGWESMDTVCTQNDQSTLIGVRLISPTLAGVGHRRPPDRIRRRRRIHASDARKSSSASPWVPRPSARSPHAAEVAPVRGSAEPQVTLSNHPWTEAIKKKLPDFEKETGLTVKLTQLGEDQLSDQYNVKLNSGTADLDVLMYRPLQEGKLFARNGWMCRTCRTTCQGQRRLRLGRLPARPVAPRATTARSSACR